MSTSRSSARQRAAASLTRRSPSLLAAQHVEGAQVVEVEHGDGQRRLAAAGAGDLARQLLVPRAACRQAGQRVGQRERADARAQLRVLDRDRGLGGEHAEHAGRRRRARRRPAWLPDHDQHAGDLAVAQHRLEQRRARAGRLDQRRGERRVGAGVGDEVGLARAVKARPPYSASRPRLDRHRRDVDADHRGRDEVAARGLEQEGDGRGGDLAGGVGRRRGGRRGCRRARAPRGRARRARGPDRAAVVGHPRRSRVELSRSSSDGEDAGEHRRTAARRRRVKRAAGARQRGEAADARAVGQLERHAEVGDARPAGCCIARRA